MVMVFCDAGVFVNGHYTELFAFYGDDNWYLDYGDDRPGNPDGNVGSVEELDEETRTVCDYVVNYRADFGNDYFMNSGWVQNHIKCSGYFVKNGDTPRHENWTIVHKTDPRYEGNPDESKFEGDWEYHTHTISKEGSVLIPYKHMD
jgi:hypothetical protein